MATQTKAELLYEISLLQKEVAQLLDEYHLIKRENSELNLRIFQLENNHKLEAIRNEQK